MSVIIKVIASSVPAICIVLGFLLLVSGFSLSNDGIIRSGWALIIIGVILQVLWLISRRL